MKYNKVKIAYSTCPNDTFMFDALINKRIDSEGLNFEVHLADIEELNNNILNGEPDVSKISYAVYPKIAKEYELLNSGSALGFGNGPLIISKKKIYPDELEHVKMAIPGKRTTANYLLSALFPAVKDRVEYLFSDIEEAILSNEVDAGLIIHETRFTYKKKGLKLIADLGQIWEEKFELPIPLGGIVVKRTVPEKIKELIQKKIRESIEFGFNFPEASMAYIKSFAQELNDEVIKEHIHLYVNEFSVDLGNTGKNAIRKLFEKGIENELMEEIDLDLFLQKQ
jgi:1,4-dihydroxy-6-naphthoate synthase